MLENLTPSAKTRKAMNTTQQELFSLEQEDMVDDDVNSDENVGVVKTDVGTLKAQTQ